MRNLSDQVTVFDISVSHPDTLDKNHPDYTTVMRALDRQTVQFTRRGIRDVAPMDAAFQRMNDLCETPFYVQIDEDMILHPHAVETLYNGITMELDDVAIYCLSLWDQHLGIPILGVKIYRADVVKNYPYRATYSCEVEQIDRMVRDGYRIVVKHPGMAAMQNHPDIVGQHGVSWTPRLIWERYMRLGQKYQRRPQIMGWVKDLAIRFLGRFKQQQNELDFYAFMGLIAGLTGDEETNTEKDFREYDNLTAFNKLYTLPLFGEKRPLVITPLRNQTAEDPKPLAPEGPRELNVYLTQTCNFKCGFCPRQHGGVEEFEYQALAPILEGVLDIFPMIKGACVAGFGEPLTSDYLDNVLNCLLQRKLFVGLITNGSLVSTRLPLLLKYSPNYVSVSMNAVTAAAHQAITGTKSFERVIKGIDLLVSAGIHVMLSFVMHQKNLDQIPDFLAFAEQHKVTNVVLHNTLPLANQRYDDPSFWEYVLTLDNTAVLDALEQAKQHPLAEHVSHWPVLISKDRHKNPLLCNSPFTSIGVDGRGFTTGCRRVMPPAEDFTHYTAEKCWYNKRYLELRQQLRAEAPRQDVCDMCFGNWRG